MEKPKTTRLIEVGAVRTWKTFDRRVAALYAPWDLPQEGRRTGLLRLDLKGELGLKVPRSEIIGFAKLYETTPEHLSWILCYSPETEISKYDDPVHQDVYSDINSDEVTAIDNYSTRKAVGGYDLYRYRRLDRIVTAGPGFVIESSTSDDKLLGETTNDPEVDRYGYWLFVSRKPSLAGPWITRLMTKDRGTVLRVHDSLAQILVDSNDPLKALRWLADESPFKDSPKTSWDQGEFHAMTDEQAKEHIEGEGNKLIEKVSGSPYSPYSDFDFYNANPEVLAKIEEQLHTMYKPLGVSRYLQTELEVYGGRSALNLLKEGHFEKVAAALAMDETALGI